MSTKKLLAELNKVHVQTSMVAAMLLAIRARMEHKAGHKNRIGKGFPNGNRGILFVGKAGVGKTRVMSRLFEGLNLGSTNEEGNVVGTWLPSTGGSSGVGMYEVLEMYNNSIIFADELSLDTEMHVHVLKQIANGELCRPRHGSIDTIPFQGLLIGATNAVKLPPDNRLEHLLATLDRFMVVQAKTEHRTPLETLDMVLDDEESPVPNWDMIISGLTRNKLYDLNAKEKSQLKIIWKNKSREIIGSQRDQFRNSQAAIDIMLFTKRFFGVNDLTTDKVALDFATQMIDDCILFNPIGILWLNPLQQVIYDKVKSLESVTTAQILTSVSKSGISVSRQSVAKALNKMIENCLLLRIDKGKYSTKLPVEVVESVGGLASVVKETPATKLVSLL